MNEIIEYSGVTEFDNIIKLNQDITINANNPYFRYIKQIKTEEKNYPVKYGELVLKKNCIYILEFKNSFVMNEKIANLQYLSSEYVKLYNINNNNINNNEFTILFFYNNREDLGYRNFGGFNINLDLWRFLYINPSCQIVPVAKLSSQIRLLKKELEEKNMQLKKELEAEKIKNMQTKKELEEKNMQLKKELEYEKSRNESIFFQINTILKDKIGFGLKLDKSQEEKYLQNQIENSFKEKIKTLTNSKGFHVFDDLFKMYEKEMNEFINVDEKDKLEVNKKNEIWKIKINEEIKDDDFKLCFEILAPCIGAKKASVNFFNIQKYIFKKSQKKEDEMHEIYNYIYSCLFGMRDINSKASKETFYKSATEKSKALLQNIIKYTFYYDKKRKGKQYYLLTLLKELINKGNDEIHETMFNLRHKTLYELIFMTIVLFNSDCSMYKDGFEYFPKK